MTLDEYDKIHALRSIEFVAHEREDWRSAVVAAFAGSAFTETPIDPQEVFRLIQLRKEEVQTVTPDAASKVTGGRGGDIRRSGREAGSG